MERLQQTAHALGSEAIITLITDDKNKADQVFDEIWRKIRVFEKRFSRFIDNSELSQFNHKAGQAICISPEFKDILRVSLLMSQKTKGIYNPFILPGLQRSGYDGSWPDTDAAQIETSNTKSITKYDSIILIHHTAKIPKYSSIDLGGIGKGYLLDQLSEFLVHRKIDRYWLSLGGDIICRGVDIDGTSWEIAVASAGPVDEDVDIILSQSKKIAVATSGVVKRQGVKGGKAWHHLIDPETGEPAITDILTATVSADSAVVADIAAKCLVIRGLTEAKRVVKMLPIKAAILQLCDGSIEKLRN